VYYPSHNGLIVVNSAGVNLITQDILTKEEWDLFNPADIYASQLGLEYIGFDTNSTGFIFNPTEPTIKLIKLNQFSGIEGIETDRYTGTVILLKNDRAFNWDPASSTRLTWQWRSKVFHLPNPLNLGAARIKFVTGDEDNTDDVVALYLPYNQVRLAAARLNTLGGHGINMVEAPGEVAGWGVAETRMPLGGSPLYPLNQLQFQASAVRLIVYAREVVVLDTVVTDERTIRLPSGFKSDLWQVEMIGNSNVYSIQLATSPKELSKV
jgi:hypothetical protein